MTNRELWQALPEELREEFDALVGKGLNIQAIFVLREKSGRTPPPSIHEGVALLDHRARVLGERDQPRQA
ncbi:hypothetical protein [Amycolatopsis eburnea]|uniref:Uncharacterized protein n=1 Tax=Amycolatopsis eburnea TaxID=2267691 RepID=A0A3R9E0D0_9PSEU|nr:hypothetical protein [Amycolatopsis eburnea]RSD19347.1 hypothetical protein EIY87_13635 [Amycolatopsis eburnea]